MLMVMVDILSAIILVGWVVVVLIVLGFILMAAFEFVRAIAGTGAGLVRTCEHWVIRRRDDARLLRQLHIRR